MSCEACKTLPTVQAKGYVNKGTYETFAGVKTYVVGPTDAKLGIIDVFDVFGMVPQTLQGADLLSASLDAIVLVPDFFHGETAKAEWLGRDTPETKAAWSDFLTCVASFEKNAPVLLQIAEEAKAKYASAARWGAYGLCWGGKILALISGAGTPFAASGQVHPGRMEKADAEKIAIPHIVLASKDEPADAVADYKQVIESNGIGGCVETYSTMPHGWMGARADLENEEPRKEYVRAYTQLAEFFGKHLK